VIPDGQKGIYPHCGDRYAEQQIHGPFIDSQRTPQQSDYQAENEQTNQPAEKEFQARVPVR
jgi:hypothetical protein